MTALSNFQRPQLNFGHQARLRATAKCMHALHVHILLQNVSSIAHVRLSGDTADSMANTLIKMATTTG
jgi:hypothetical protein